MLEIGKRGNLINKFRFEHLRDYDDMTVSVPGMTDGQVRPAIVRTLFEAKTPTGTPY